MHLESVSILPSSNPFHSGYPTVRRLPSFRRAGAVAMVAIAFSFLLPVSLVGCGMEAAPQPPSLQLPKPIQDLIADRTGNQVHLAWSTPKENTDHLKLQGMVRLRLCRQLQAASPCETIATISAVPDKPAQYTDALPPSLTAGPARAIAYRIFGINKRGKTAGPSNVATVLAGAAPPQVRNLSAQVVERGVVLRWQPGEDLPPGTSIQIDRKSAPLKPRNGLNGPPTRPTRAKNFNPLPRSTEPVQQKLRVSLVPADKEHAATPPRRSEIDPGIALDRSAQFGREYSYTASRVIQQQVGKQTLQIANTPSAAVQVTTRDTFPPAAPSGLVAVPVSAAMNNGKAEVDLSWSANTEPDLAQYRVYRSDVTANGPMRRIGPDSASGSQTEDIVAPAFRDAQVQAGHTYLYTVTAVDASGNESHQSAEVSVTVPTS
ncbi:MAG: fibronectin type III domain-containing protein [Acidobacteriaceae bacterium]